MVTTVILAAGALPWRRRRGALQVAMVHRPRYDDWSWAKGKLDPGEEWPVAAVREVLEETGFQVHLGRTLPSSEYIVTDQSGHPSTKTCRYWAAEVVGGDGKLVNEIDKVAWLDVEEALARLTYPRDHDQLHALVRADQAGTLTTWPLVIVRHAKSRSRSSWSDVDLLRPLNARGRERAEALVPILAAYGVTRVVTSPALRCLDTVLPYAVAAGQRPRLKDGLSEEAFSEQPGRAPHHLTQLIERGNAAVLCTHGPVLPVLLADLAGIADSSDTGESGKAGKSGASSTSGEAGESRASGTSGEAGESRASGTSGESGASGEFGESGEGVPSGDEVASGEVGENTAKATLSDAAELGIGKGEALVAHLVGTGVQARVIDVERFATP